MYLTTYIWVKVMGVMLMNDALIYHLLSIPEYWCLYRLEYGPVQ